MGLVLALLGISIIYFKKIDEECGLFPVQSGGFVSRICSYIIWQEVMGLKKLRSRPLLSGGKIGIAAPASPVKDQAEIEAGAELLLNLGFQTVLGETARPLEGYLAGSDLERRADLERFWRDDSIDAIWCLRGGYGSARLLPNLYLGLIERNPKILIGFSDIAGIELGLWKRTKLVTFHGPVLTTLKSEFSIKQALQTLAGETVGKPLFWPENKRVDYLVFKEGKARGPLLGGNLALVSSLLGTGYFPDLEGAILFLEETEEPPYRIDRMLTQLLESGVLDVVAGIMIGRCNPIEGKAEEDIIKVWAERLSKVASPAAYGFPIGHIPEQWTLPQGIGAEVDFSAGEVILVESPFISEREK
jgi:muramoyltetrapeptide carboxypeptidase